MGDRTTETELDANKLQRRMLLYYTEDGLWDVCLGACLLGWALFLRLDMMPFIFLVVVGAVGLVPTLKHVLTYPRAGYARLKTDADTRGLLVFFVGFCAAVPMLFVVASWLGFAVAALAVLFARALHVWRFYVYTSIALLAGAAAAWGEGDLWLTTGAGGAVIAACGLALVVKFVRGNPRTAAEPNG
jgi:hypothetical protein